MKPIDICRMALNEKNKSKKVILKGDKWEEYFIRPIVGDNSALMAHEIYKKPVSISEKETVCALNELVANDEAEVLIKYDCVWYIKK